MIEQLVRPPAQDLSTLYIDMDSFFASVAQACHPALRGRPVGVCPCLADNCAVVSASREAKMAGIKVGMRIAEARRRLPEMEFVADSPVSYRDIHRIIVEILDQTPCQIGVRGIDEAYLKLPSYLVGQSPAIEQLARAIKSQLAARLGSCITASIGASANIWLAKMAASSCKPDGVRLLRLVDLVSFYGQLRLTDFTGISWRLARQLYRKGIYEPKALYRASYSFLSHIMGVNGGKWWLRLRGFEVDLHPSQPKKSMSHQATLMPRPATSTDQVYAVLTKIAAKLAYRLRRAGLYGRGATIWLRHLDSRNWQGQIKFSRVTNSPQSILRELKKLATPVLESQNFLPIQRVSVAVAPLTDAVQLNLIGEDERRFDDLSVALDAIYSKWGRDTIVPASSLGASIVPDRIGFGSSIQTPFS